jgi:hypothetical protein
MINRKIYLSVILSLISLIYIYPQNKDTTRILGLVSVIYTHPQNKDTTKDNISSWIYEYCYVKGFQYDFSGNPTIAVNYGLSKVGIENFDESFQNPALLEVKLGYTHENNNFMRTNIIDYSFNYFYTGNTSVNLTNNSSGGAGLKTDLWRFGFGNSSGYGYNLGAVAIIPYHNCSFEWSRLRMEDTPLNAIDESTTDLFNQTFRAGNSEAGGIMFQFLPGISIDAGYERSVIFPRFMFWKWAGGALIEVAGQSVINSFLSDIFDSSPYAAPVLNFLLKNALSYGLFQLRHNEMNWPFNTAEPLAYDQFKFGLTFVL